MKSIVWIVLMMLFLTSCARDLKFDGFNPTTTAIRWIIQNDSRD